MKNTRLRDPKYRLHKPSGRGVIQFAPLYGKNPKYLRGAFKSEESWAHYYACCDEIRAFKQGRTAPPRPTCNCNVEQLIEQFLAFAEIKYPKRGSRGEYTNIFAAMRPLRAAHAKTMVDKFGPLALIEVRKKMIARGWARKHINNQIHRVRRAFRWGVENELVSGETYQRLVAVAPLRKGEARETPLVKPVPRADVEAVLPYLRKTVRDMVEVQWLTGMRSGELTSMRIEEIDRSNDVWLYCPAKHKTDADDRLRVIPIGPDAQSHLMPYLFNRPYLFAPPKRLRSHDQYSTESYYRSIQHGFVALLKSKGVKKETPKGKPWQPAGVTWKKWFADHGVAVWHPHQLRHSRATLTRQRYGKDGAEAQLGNSPEATDIYALPSLPLAMQIARETG